MTHYDSVPGQASGLSQSRRNQYDGRPQKLGLPHFTSTSVRLHVPTSLVRIVPSGRSCDDWCVDWRPLLPAPGSATQRQPAGAELGSLPPSQLETHLPPIVGLESQKHSKLASKKLGSTFLRSNIIGESFEDKGLFSTCIFYYFKQKKARY